MPQASSIFQFNVVKIIFKFIIYINLCIFLVGLLTAVGIIIPRIVFKVNKSSKFALYYVRFERSDTANPGILINSLDVTPYLHFEQDQAPLIIQAQSSIHLPVQGVSRDQFHS
ncbi:MAG TPA: hypothetical protein DCM28_18320 [Phycisphaerales bacterium]|nr:hypothetical protein [Phycisphaerales bacterium]